MYIRLVLVCGGLFRDPIDLLGIIGIAMRCYIWYQAHDMAYVSVLDAWTCPRGDVPGLGSIKTTVF
jgi:hypothetical protein